MPASPELDHEGELWRNVNAAAECRGYILVGVFVFRVVVVIMAAALDMRGFRIHE